MENRVGDTAPTPTEMTAIQTQVQVIHDELVKFCVMLTGEERHSRLKPLRGAEAPIRKVYDLCQRYGVSLKSVPLDGMMADLNLVVMIAPLVAVLQTSAQLSEDTQNQAFSEAWQAFLAYYGALLKASEHDAALAVEMEDIIAFMAIYGTKRKGAAKTKAPAAPAPKTP